MKRETLEKAIAIREEILQIERMSSIVVSGRKAYFAFQEGMDANPDKRTYFSDRMTTKMVSMLLEYKLELEKEIEEL